MSCPNCNQAMQEKILDKQKVLHCSNCGGSFFEENGINRITTASAQILSEDKKNEEVSGAEKKCPKDQQILKPISTSFNEFQPISSPLPQDVTLLHCPKCQGVFAYADDLLRFKEAQEAKINYLKTWKIPLPSLRAVAILSFFIVAGLVFAQYIFWQKGALTPSQAEGLIKRVYLSSSGHYLFVSFQTQIPIRSRINFYDKTTNKIIEKIISDKPNKIHSITITDLTLEDTITYQIVLIDEKGREMKTEEKRLILP